MKRNAKSRGPGSRLRWGLLLATAAAFLLVPAAQAFAAGTGEVVFAGEGSGWVKGGESEPGEGGEPPIDCHWNGHEIDIGTSPTEGGVSGLHECKTNLKKLFGVNVLSVSQEADAGSEFGGFMIIGKEAGGGEPIFCIEGSGVTEFCSIAGEPNATLKATFNKIPLLKFALSTSTSGAAGSVKCKINGGSKGSCPAEVEETSSVELFAEPATGNELNEWTTGPCAGSSSNPCSFTMPAVAVSANAEFKVASESLSATGSGPGSVACEVNSISQPCVGTYKYGDTIKVVATPSGAPGENKVGSVTVGGSAACVNVETSATCEFVLHANSTVAVVFEPAGTKDQTPVTVEGEVPITTSLEGCEAPVVLGPFVPAVAANYEGTCTVTATSTGNASELSAADGDVSATTKGHLVQPPYKLPSALETRAKGLSGLEFPGTGFPYAPLSNPSVTLLTYAGPVSADNVTVHFKQHIGLHDALHTGTYAKTITLTLEQTAL